MKLMNGWNTELINQEVAHKMVTRRTNKKSKFAKIRTEWVWRNQLREFSSNAKLVGMYLLTAPSFNMLGLFAAPISTICIDTGLIQSAVLEAIEELTVGGFIKYNKEREEVWVMHMAGTQTGVGKLSANQEKGVINELIRLCETKFSFVDDFREAYQEVYKFLPENLDELEYDMSADDIGNAIAKPLVTR